jgi:hypothetical protein
VVGVEQWTWWRRIDAERWVYRILQITTVLGAVAAFFVGVFALAQGVLLVVPLAALVAALPAWFTSAWRRGRRWAWWVLVIGAAWGVVQTLVELLAPSPWTFVGLALNVGFLLLLCHPDCRPRIHGPVAELGTRRDPALEWVGRDY